MSLVADYVQVQSRGHAKWAPIAYRTAEIAPLVLRGSNDTIGIISLPFVHSVEEKPAPESAFSYPADLRARKQPLVAENVRRGTADKQIRAPT